MKFRSFVLAAVAAASVMGFSACGDGDDGSDGATPESSPTVVVTEAPVTPTVAASPTPQSDGPSGILSVDEAIELVLAGDFEAVEGLFVFQNVACEVDVMGAGGPPQCEADEADGTEVEVLPVSQCEGAYLRQGDVFLAQRLRDQEMTLYAVYDASNVELFLPGEFAVLFSYERPEMPGQTLTLELLMNDEGVTGVNFGCGEDPATLAAAQGLTEAIVAPE
jgi:hypothetical protein